MNILIRALKQFAENYREIETKRGKEDTDWHAYRMIELLSESYEQNEYRLFYDREKLL